MPPGDGSLVLPPSSETISDNGARPTTNHLSWACRERRIENVIPLTSSKSNHNVSSRLAVSRRSRLRLLHPSFSRRSPRAHASSMRGGFDGPGKPGHQHHLALRGPPCSMLGYPLSVATQFAVGATVAIPSPAARIGFFGKPLRRPTVCSRGAPRSSPQPNKTSQKHSPHVAVTHVLDNVVSAHSAPSSHTSPAHSGGGGGDGWR
jgi:hypothetical protein